MQQAAPGATATNPDIVLVAINFIGTPTPLRATYNAILSSLILQIIKLIIFLGNLNFNSVTNPVTGNISYAFQETS